MEKNLIMNIDWRTATCPFLERILENGNVTNKDLFVFIDDYIDLANGKASQLGAIAFNIFCQISFTRSECMPDFTVYRDNDIDVETIMSTWCEPFCELREKYGIDPWQVWFDRCRQRGCEAWLSVRMNDTHDSDFEECTAEAFSFRSRWREYAIGEKYGYYWKCMDYSHPDVRNHFLNYIKEQIAMYDIDALELDFMREVFSFDYISNPDCHVIMTEFMRNVKALVDRESTVKGRKIKISVRLPRDIEQCKVFGFDVEAWAAEKLVDHITVTPRWATCDDSMPVCDWKKRFPHIEIAAGVETLLRFDDLRTENGRTSHVDADMVNGLSASYFSMGADQIYLYNFFWNPFDTNCDYYERTVDILSRCGDKSTALSTSRRHIVMYQDIAPQGYNCYKPLPMVVKDGQKNVWVFTGEIPDNSNTRLRVAFSRGNPDNTRIYINSKECSNFKPCDCSALQQFNDNLFEMRFDNRAAVKVGDTVWMCDVVIENTRHISDVTFVSSYAIIDHVEIIVE